jgi:[NiFe] hydrogenase diaphorase moiety small subunit
VSTPCNKFRPAYERRLVSLDFEPAFDLDAALAKARQLTGRDDAGAHLQTHEEWHDHEPAVPLDGSPCPSSPARPSSQAARKAAGYIPHLCWHPDFPPTAPASCARQGQWPLRSACTIAGQEGMEVRSRTAEIERQAPRPAADALRRGQPLLPLLRKERQLRAAGHWPTSTEMLSPHFDTSIPDRPVDASHPDVLLDFNRCIMCELCVRASRDVDGKNVFAITGRGIDKAAGQSAANRAGWPTPTSPHRPRRHICPVGVILPKRRASPCPSASAPTTRPPISAARRRASAMNPR